MLVGRPPNPNTMPWTATLLVSQQSSSHSWTFLIVLRTVENPIASLQGRKNRLGHLLLVDNGGVVLAATYHVGTEADHQARGGRA